MISRLGLRYFFKRLKLVLRFVKNMSKIILIFDKICNIWFWWISFSIVGLMMIFISSCLIIVGILIFFEIRVVRMFVNKMIVIWMIICIFFF